MAPNFKDELVDIALAVHSGMTVKLEGAATFIRFLCLWGGESATVAAAVVKGLPSLNCKNIFSAARHLHCRWRFWEVAKCTLTRSISHRFVSSNIWMTDGEQDTPSRVNFKTNFFKFFNHSQYALVQATRYHHWQSFHVNCIKPSPSMKRLIGQNQKFNCEKS